MKILFYSQIVALVFLTIIAAQTGTKAISNLAHHNATQGTDQ
jgi:hypothetical protein